MAKQGKVLKLNRETLRGLRVQTKLLTGIKADSGPYVSIGDCGGGGTPVPPSAGQNPCIGEVQQPYSTPPKMGIRH